MASDAPTSGETVPQDSEQPDDLLYEAWCVIANAHQGDWDAATPEWKAAAERWRDRWHLTLNGGSGT